MEKFWILSFYDQEQDPLSQLLLDSVLKILANIQNHKFNDCKGRGKTAIICK